jgi:hypothetical protein
MSRRDQIYPEVEHAILACLAYGRFLLNETVLAQHYDVSRTIAHEVLTQLSRGGVIEQDSNKSVVRGSPVSGALRSGGCAEYRRDEAIALFGSVIQMARTGAKQPADQAPMVAT